MYRNEGKQNSNSKVKTNNVKVNRNEGENLKKELKAKKDEEKI